MSTFDESFKKTVVNGRIQCSICSILIPNSMVIQHNVNHFSHSGYSAEVCKFCMKSITTNDVESILEHMIYDHNMKSDCPICEEELEKMDDLYYHLQENLKIMYHCQEPDCMMMTDKKFELIIHQKDHVPAKQRSTIIKKGKYELNHFLEVVFYCKYGDRNGKKLSGRKLQEAASLNVPTYPKTSIINQKPVKHQLVYTPQSAKRFKITSNGKEINENQTGKLSVKSFLKINKNCETFDRKILIFFTYSERVLNKYLAVCFPKFNEDFKTELSTLNKFPMAISIEDQTKKFSCESCGYCSFHSYTDIKRHIIRHHCGVSNKSLTIIMKVSKCNSNYNLIPDSELIRLLNNDISSKNLNANSLLTDSDNESVHVNETIDTKPKIHQQDSRTSLHNFHFSERVLRKLLKASNLDVIDEILSKLTCLDRFKMSIHMEGKMKKYTCTTCQYYSVHSHTDIKRHIFRSHCDLSNKYMKIIMKVSKNNSEMSPLNDSEQINQINNDISSNDPDGTLLSDSDFEPDENCNQSSFTKSFNKSDLRMIREINCAYSRKILQSICLLENCSHIFDKLRQKMDIYAKHSVQIYLRNDLELFVCSGCNWYSKQKINDVMKHIMNHHAQFESQSKEIRKMVETSCKTDKENLLLSDHEISEKGWKGRKILI